MSGKSSTISSQEPMLGGIQVQTSTYGLTIGLLWGRPRVPGNLLWYDDFKAIPHSEVTESGGKGGGGVRQEQTSYTYEAAVAMGIAAGPINGIVTAWKGKDRFSGVTVASQTRTVQEQFSVPLSGIYTVAGVAIFARSVAVRFPANNNSGDENGWAGVLVEGVDYTAAGGTYTFNVDWVGIVLEVEYQVADSASTTSALGQLGLNLATGTLGQPTWSHLTANHPGQAIGYSGLAYVYATNYRLTSSAQVENHNFEVSTPSEFSSSIPDANMAVVVKEFLTDGLRGCLWPAAKLGDLTHFSNYCVSHGLFMSPALLEQAAAADILKGWLKLTNSDVVWSALQLKVVPLGDESKTANGATYTANTTPVYDLVPTDFVTDGEQPRIRITPRVNEDAYNHVRVEYQNRANGYNLDIISAKDLAHIEQFGERVMEVIKAHDVKTAEVASFVAQMELQRQMSVWNTYNFTLPWTKGRLEPLDLVTLTDEQQTLDRLPVRIKKIVEVDDDAYDVEAEDAPIGHASAPLFGTQAGSGYAPDYNAAPGDALAPVVFEAPGELTASGLELLVATAGSNSLWGGCQVWASYDGTNYQQIGELRGGSRYGALTAAVGSTAPVSIHGGQLLSGTASDLAALATLCYIGGATPEYFAYETATLTSANHYTLSTLNRGAYGTSSSAHTTGDPFVRVDGALARSGPLDTALVGTTVHIKLTSFNVYGGGQQSLADVSATTYVISGAFIPATGGSSFSLQATAQAVTFNGADVAAPASQTITLKAVLGGLTGTATFVATRYDAAGASLGTVTLGGSGNTRTLTEAQFGVAAYCVVTATLGAASDQTTIVRLRDGTTSLVGMLSNESANVAATSAGVVGSFSGTGGTFRVFRGLVDLTGDVSVTYSVFSSSGVTIGIDSAGVYTISGLSTDTGTATLRAVCAGITLDKIYSISKSKAGTNGTNGFNGSNGTNGSNGSDGLNSATVYIYQRSASGAPALPSATATYTFSSSTTTGLNNGWSATIPAGTALLYVSAAAAVSSSGSDTISPGEWASAQLMAQDGLNSATVFLYQRSNALFTPPSVPGSTTTYTFSTGVLSGSLGSWSQTIPAISAGKYLYVTTATALSTTATDSITTGEWATVRQLVENGSRGPVNVAWPVGSSGSIWTWGGGGSGGPADTAAAAAVSSATGGDTPKGYDIVTLYVAGTQYSETRFLHPTAGVGWVAMDAYLSTRQLMANAATEVYQDFYNFGGGAFGTYTPRSFTVTPTDNCTIEVTSSMSADNVYGDGGNSIGWYVTPSGGSVSALFGTYNNDTIRRDFAGITLFAATGGVPLTFEIRTSNGGGASIHLFLSRIRLVMVKR